MERRFDLVAVGTGVTSAVWYVAGRKRGTDVLRLLCRISLEPDC